MFPIRGGWSVARETASVQSTTAFVSVLGDITVDSKRLSRAPDRLTLLALVARRNDEVARRPLADLLDRLGQGGTMAYENRPPMNPARAGRKLSESLSRLTALLNDRLRKNPASASLRILEGECDVDRFEAACAMAQNPAVAPAKRIAAADLALSILTFPLWPDLSEPIDDDLYVLRPFRETLERQRGAVAVARAFDLLRLGEYSTACEIESLVPNCVAPDGDPNAALAAIFARWANGDHTGALHVLRSIEDRYAGLGFGARSDYAEIERCLLDRDRFSADRLPGRGAASQGEGATPDPTTGFGAVVRTLPRSAQPTESLPGPWHGRLQPSAQVVGRAGDLLHLGLGIDAVSGRSARCWQIAGPTGIGRTRFLEAADAMSRERGFDTAFISAAEHEFEAGGTLLSLIGQVDPLAAAEVAAGVAADPAVLAAALAGLARFGPLVFLIDDLQHATPLDLAAIEVVLSRPTRSYPVHFVCGLNPDVAAGGPEAASTLASLGRHRRTEVMTLRPFNHSALSALSASLFGKPMEAADIEAILAATAGNPARIQRGLSMLVDAELVRNGSVSVSIEPLALDRWALGGEATLSPAQFLPGQSLTAQFRPPQSLPGQSVGGGWELARSLALLGSGCRALDVFRLVGGMQQAVEEELGALSERSGGALVVAGGRVFWPQGMGVPELSAGAASIERQHVLEAVAAFARILGDSPNPDRELDAHLAKWLRSTTAVSPEDLIAADPSVDLRQVRESLSRSARARELGASWVAAAQLWDVAADLSEGQDRCTAQLSAGIAWTRGHDGDRADARLRLARAHTTPERAAEALLWWARANASLLWPGAAVVSAEIDEWIDRNGQHVDGPAVARLHAVLAEAFAVEQNEAEANDRLVRARSCRPVGDQLDPAEVDFAAGVADLMAFRSRSAVGHFGAALKSANGDGWISSWCAARTLLLRAITAPLEVSIPQVAAAKSTCLSALSWSDALMCSLGAAQSALVQGDRTWARSELREAIEYRDRSEYGLLDQPIRLLWAQLHEGTLWRPDEVADDLLAQWVASWEPGYSWRAETEAAVSDWTARLEGQPPDLWNSAAIAILADTVARSGAGDRGRAAALLDRLVSNGNRWVFGVGRDLHDLATELR